MTYYTVIMSLLYIDRCAQDRQSVCDEGAVIQTSAHAARLQSASCKWPIHISEVDAICIINSNLDKVGSYTCLIFQFDVLVKHQSTARMSNLGLLCQRPADFPLR